jgi:hypothetical protein
MWFRQTAKAMSDGASSALLRVYGLWQRLIEAGKEYCNLFTTARQMVSSSAVSQGLRGVNIKFRRIHKAARWPV